jgi:hypothetical protein
MAYTVTTTKKTVFGDMRVHHLEVTADAATGTVATGLSVVESMTYAPKSMATAAVKLRKNALPAGTASAGSVAVSGAASGDAMFLTIYGR